MLCSKLRYYGKFVPPDMKRVALYGVYDNTPHDSDVHVYQCALNDPSPPPAPTPHRIVRPVCVTLCVVLPPHLSASPSSLCPIDRTGQPACVACPGRTEAMPCVTPRRAPSMIDDVPVATRKLRRCGQLWGSPGLCLPMRRCADDLAAHACRCVYERVRWAARSGALHLCETRLSAFRGISTSLLLGPNKLRTDLLWMCLLWWNAPCRTISSAYLEAGSEVPLEVPPALSRYIEPRVLPTMHPDDLVTGDTLRALWSLGFSVFHGGVCHSVAQDQSGFYRP